MATSRYDAIRDGKEPAATGFSQASASVPSERTKAEAMRDAIYLTNTVIDHIDGLLERIGAGAFADGSKDEGRDNMPADLVSVLNAGPVILGNKLSDITERLRYLEGCLIHG